MKKLFSFLIVFLFLNVSFASAMIGGFSTSNTDWALKSFTKSHKRYYYIDSQPMGKFNNAEFIVRLMFVKGKIALEPMLYSYYKLKKNIPIKLNVINGSNKSRDYNMCHKGGVGWILLSVEEKALLSEMSKGRYLSVKTIAENGRQVDFTFSLKGLSLALHTLAHIK